MHTEHSSDLIIVYQCSYGVCISIRCNVTLPGITAMALRGCVPVPLPPGPEGELMTMLDLPYNKTVNHTAVIEGSEEHSGEHSKEHSRPSLEALTDVEVSEEGKYLENLAPKDFVAFKVITILYQ
jgi:hypothetical protein